MQPLFTAFAFLATCVANTVATPLVPPAPEWFTTITTSSNGHATTLTIAYDSPTPTYTATVSTITMSFDTVTPIIDPFPTD
ncbi:hypothetical protein V8D89_005355, partial [Ganoderma adspersum]